MTKHTWLAVRCTASAVSELARVEWHSVGGVCRRVYAELEAARGASRFDGVRVTANVISTDFTNAN